MKFVALPFNPKRARHLSFGTETEVIVIVFSSSSIVIRLVLSLAKDSWPIYSVYYALHTA